MPPDRPSLDTGDPSDAFARLFDAHARSLHRYLARRTDSSVADDLVAETFLVAFDQRATYRPEWGTVRSWLYGIATNLLRRHARTELRSLRATARMARADEHHVENHESRVVEALDARARTRALAARLTELTTADRDTLLLSAWAGLEYAEIAEALGIPVGTVRSRLHRVRRVLRGGETTSGVVREVDDHA